MKSDPQLIDLAINGDTGAFSELYRRHHAAVLRFAERVVGHQAADVTQECFLSAYLSLKRLENPKAFRGWLYGIALNLCRKVIRERVTNANLARQMSGGWSGDGCWPAPDEQLLLKYEAGVVRRAVLELPPKLRRAVELYYLELLSVEETSALLGVSESATKTRLHRARRALKAKLLERRKQMRKVEILDVISDGIVLFIDWEDARVIPIFMSKEQVNSIAIGVKGVEIPRPLTFQFMANLLAELGGEVEWVCITTLSDEGTFYAKVKLTNGKEIDARPSDAVNLAVVVAAPIYADEELIKKVGIKAPIDDAKRKIRKAKGLDALAEELKMLTMVKLQREGLEKYVRFLFSGGGEDEQNDAPEA